ncbi:MAG: hypothetical protein D5S00_07235 [Tindallia sp. MSAO_Bac2]|nr:MAG: hypothetical protein D5S00_07235 [Tindallia sp. MSAO_Bac2]
MRDWGHLDQIIPNYNGKSNFSAASEKIYTEEMHHILQMDGYGKKIEELIFNGPPEASVKAFWSYLVTVEPETRVELLTAFFSSERFLDNKGGASFNRALLLLLSACENGDEDKVIYKILSGLDKVIINKKGKINDKTVSDFKRLFLKKITDHSTIKNINLAGESSTRSLYPQFVRLLKKTLDVYKANNEEYTDIYQMLSLFVSALEEEEEVEEDKEVNELHVNGSIKNDRNSVHKLSQLSIPDSLRELAQAVEKIEFENSSLEREKKELEIEADKLKSKVEKTIKENETLSLTGKNLQKRYFQLEEALRITEANLLEKNKIISNLQLQIEKQSKVISLYDEDKQNSLSEFINSLSSKLRAEYSDFKDAVELDMSIELGENIRQQLIEVFKILQKNGIALDRR